MDAAVKKAAVEKTWNVQSRITVIMNDLKRIKPRVEQTDRETLSVSITELASISNEVMSIRTLLQPPRKVIRKPESL